METLRLALDWTPNINHIGFYVAQKKGFYESEGLNVHFISPSSDHYTVTPAKKVEKGLADFALCPTESVISYRTKKNPFDLIGIATIFQKDISAIAVRSDRGIQSPKDLDGKRYASYKARYEDAIVQQMIRNDGGSGNIIVDYPEKLGIWDTLLVGSFDATWIFLNWEGIEADSIEESLTYFKMEDYGIPYSYSPLIAASEENVRTRKEAYQRFIHATRKGYLHCFEDQYESIESLRPHVPFYDSKIALNKALELTLDYLEGHNAWGEFDESNVEKWLDWIHVHKLEPKKLEVNEVITNQFFH